MDTPRTPAGTVRFPPGTLLAGRYRIVAPLGEGGMGEVYRADDLKLRQAVALKFLPASVASDPSRLALFYDEVRTAREVSHPNVCRVHDLGEAEGQHFLSMEYVDGEDLASLLRRIGRLPRDKGIEIARQLCAGLAAAHEKGVLHRDLKPANVMIDGRGRVRLADFGLAGLAEEIEGQAGAGTPAYMPPEQFAGREVSVRSDIYALGLVLYEVFTGRPVFQGTSRAELARLHESGVPSRPSSHVPDLEPAIERAILRCLEKDPLQRPASALAVSAALPGGDPLAAALAAGITPSPEMVAGAGEVGVLPLPVAWRCLGFVILGLVVAGLLARGSALYRHVPLEKPPDALTDRARQIVKLAGVVEAPGDWAGWLESTDNSPGHCGVGHVCFIYRQSRRFLEPRSGTVRRDDPPLLSPGMVRVVLTTEGRLTHFSVVPPEFDDSPAAPPPDWTPLLAEAGFDTSDLAPSEPLWTPRVASDRRAAWEVRAPERHGQASRVEAASFRGRRADFRVVWPWDIPEDRTPASWFPWFHRLFGWWGMIPLGTLIVVMAAAVLARRNLALGRSDRTG
ncbi:MAG TPA: serine/threonine-protein kinase, partial [Vicinamibacteria bacterium]